MHTTPEEIEAPKGSDLSYRARAVAHLAWFWLEPGAYFLIFAFLPGPESIVANWWGALLLAPGIVPAIVAGICHLWLWEGEFDYACNPDPVVASCILSMFWFWYRVAAVLCLAAVCLLGHYFPWPGVWFGLVLVANIAAAFGIVAGTRAVIKNAEGL
ncbi:MAG: hypothetical protein KJ052_20090 [Candidatus Hydrogenedentes bacterium]|nr:hypothetical protein [Candidatus Hydrogenedentota bacterium]